MIQKSITVSRPNGLEARPIAELVQVASRFDSKIYLVRNNKRVNAKSIMGMMTLELGHGDKVDVSVDGADESVAMNEVEGFLQLQA